MKIAADQIESKAIAGKTDDGRPIVYILTKGGLHAFFCKDKEGHIASIGAAPHKAIARFLAGKKETIKWDSGFEKSEDSLSKSESDQFEKLRTLMFMKSFEQPVGPEDVLVVYDIKNSKFNIMKSEDFNKKEYNDSCLIRSCALNKPPVPIFDYFGGSGE
jgi:hypothetical protein